MYIVYCFIFIISFNKCFCNIQFQNVPIKSDLDGVLGNYLKPISKLSELFPNQQVEVQFEIDGSNNGLPNRYLRQRTETSTIASSTPSDRPVILPVSSVPVATDRPVYMSDLKKVFEDFEKKHTNQFHNEVKQAPFVNIKQTVGNLNDLLGLLRKGVQVEKGVGKPTAENMSWFQIKIPRN